MKALIDEDICLGCGKCGEICPEVFRMNSKTAKIVAMPVPVDTEPTCRCAKEHCPGEAIIIEYY